MRILGFVCLLVLAGLAFIRLAPIKPSAFVLKGPFPLEGDFEVAGGFTAVRKVAADPQEVLAAVTAAMLALPRTRIVSDDPRAFVTRSRVFGFPDVTVVAVQDGMLILRGHLVFGKADLGVNKTRIVSILNALNGLTLGQ